MQLSRILEASHTTATQIARDTGINPSTLTQAYKKPIDTWSVRVLNATAKGLRTTPARLLEQLQGDKYELEINDDEQVIQGVHFPDSTEYHKMRFLVVNETLEGWKPSREDILRMADRIAHPDASVIKEYESVFGKQK